MPTAQSNRLHRYRKHKPTGQAVVTLDGHDFYLGPWTCAASRREYDRLTGEWLAAGRRLPQSTSGEVSVVELAAAYWKYASGYYRKGGKATRTQERVKLSLRHLRRLYGETPVDQFGPLALQAMQQRFVREGKSRPYVNCLIEQIRRVFKWGVSQELVPALVFQALATVPGLRKGRTEAPEPEPVGPVESEVVESTMPHLPPVVREMVQLQRLTGARPGEICILRPCDVDRTADIWLYRPESHKTEHHGRERTVYIGPRGQEVLRPYLLRDMEAYCNDWIALAQVSGIRMLINFAKTLMLHCEGILNYYEHRISTGPLEGTNNKIKTMKRQAYGFRDHAFFKLKIMGIHETKFKLVG